MHTSRKKIPINAILLQGPNITVKAITAKKVYNCFPETGT